MSNPGLDSAPGASEAPPPRVRLLVVDADRRVRAGLAGLLGLADRVEVVGSASHAQAAIDACEACSPDVVVVDPRLPELPEGIAFIRGLRARRPDVRVIVVAWLPSLALLLADDAGIKVLGADGGDLAERIIDALRPAWPERGADGTDADGRLGATA